MSTATHAESLSDRDYDIWKLQFEKLHSGLIDAGKSVNKHSLTLALIVSVFAIITYGNFAADKINVPLLSLELSKWNAAILGPPFMAMGLYTFACSRTVHQ
jgi:cadmium resistance protein CadD (predicted permease)